MMYIVYQGSSENQNLRIFGAYLLAVKSNFAVDIILDFFESSVY